MCRIPKIAEERCVLDDSFKLELEIVVVQSEEPRAPLNDDACVAGFLTWNRIDGRPEAAFLSTEVLGTQGLPE